MYGRLIFSISMHRVDLKYEALFVVQLLGHLRMELSGLELSQEADLGLPSEQLPSASRQLHPHDRVWKIL